MLLTLKVKGENGGRGALEEEVMEEDWRRINAEMTGRVADADVNVRVEMELPNWLKRLSSL